jgi:hypothetical protein
VQTIQGLSNQTHPAFPDIHLSSPQLVQIGKFLPGTDRVKGISRLVQGEAAALPDSLGRDFGFQNPAFIFGDQNPDFLPACIKPPNFIPRELTFAENPAVKSFPAARHCAHGLPI